MENEKAKWYDNRLILIVLLFLIPPIGIYGMFKRGSKLWVKLVYLLGAFVTMFIWFTIVVVIAVSEPPKSDYELGVQYFEMGEYEDAIKYFNNMDSDDKFFDDALIKTDSSKIRLQRMKDVLIAENLKNEQILLEKTEDLMLFQKRWADSVVKVESRKGNRHLVSSVLKLPDTILFEYTESITRKGFEVNLQNDEVLYGNWYRKDIITSLGIDYPPHNVFISCIPNKNVDYNEVLAERKARKERADKIRSQFSAWDGSHRKLERLVKDNMKDPSSFDHVETNYADKGDYILVQMRYRGKNSFGALTLETITARADINGDIYKIE